MAVGFPLCVPGRVALAAFAVSVGGALLTFAATTYRAHRAVTQAETEQAWGRLEAARDTLTRAASMTPKDARIHAALGSVNASIAQFRGSKDAELQTISAYLQATMLNPADPNLHAKLATAYTQFGHASEATAAYRQALELDPHNALLLASLATLRERQGRYEDAARLYREALEIRPNDSIESSLERIEAR